METVAPGQGATPERPGLPIWTLVVGGLLVAVFAGLVLETYSGRSTVSRIEALLPAPTSEMLTDTAGLSALYVPGDTVVERQSSVGARGQDHPMRAGDLVLLGARRRLVRLGAANRLTEVRAAEGTTLPVAGLGGWDEAAGRIAGGSVRFTDGVWIVDVPEARPAGPNLLDPRVPEEELPGGFKVSPEGGGRVRRSISPSGPVLRLRPNSRMNALGIEGWEPLTGLNGVPVTVQAKVRASEGATVELALADVVDEAGNVQWTADRRQIEREDDWQTLRVQRRVLFPSDRDRYVIQLVDVRNRDWLEVAAFEVYLGGRP
jgi:hypothetical protein